jgi:hypothetical protein
MNDQDKQRFLENITWFNNFFEDLKLLFDKIGNSLSVEFSMGDPNYYYYKSTSTPSIPAYYVMAQGSDSFTIQNFAIFNPSIIENVEAFNPDPSIILLRHSRGDRVLYIEEFGLRVIRNRNIRQEKINDQVVSGTILGGEETQYQAFQLPYETFASGKNLSDVIRSEVVDVLEKLPDL